MKLPLAWLNLTHEKRRTAIAVAGVVFAAVLILMQLGFYHAVEATATLLYDQLDFDVLLTSSEYLDLNRSRHFPAAYLQQVLENDQVRSAVPVHVGFNLWHDPRDRNRRWNIMVVAIDPTDPVFDARVNPELAAETALLKQPDTVLIDRGSRPEFGPQTIGARRELGTHAVTLAGRYRIGTGFGANGMVVTSLQTYDRTRGGVPPEGVSLGLLKLKDPSQAESVVDALRRRLPPDVRVWTRQAMNERECRYWVRNTSLGTFFTLGVAVALGVGGIFFYQVMSSDIANRIGEYATLKAMGYPIGYLRGVVLQQALFLSLLGYGPGLVIALGLYALTRELVGLPITLSPVTALLVFALTVGMCMISGAWAMAKLKNADPADLF